MRPHLRHTFRLTPTAGWHTPAQIGRCRALLGSRRDRKDRAQRRRYSTGVALGVGAQGFRDASSTCGKSEALSGLPHAPMIMRHGGVGQAEMGEGVVDRIGKGRDAADVVFKYRAPDV